MTSRTALLLAAPGFLVAGCDGSPSQPALPDAGQDGFRTESVSFARGLDGASTTPLLTVGDVVPGSPEAVAPAPLGLGVRPHGGQLVVHVSHELDAVPRDGGGEAYGAGRISRFTMDRETGDILGHDHAVDGSEGYREFGSGTWAGAAEGFGDGYFFAGEKTANGLQLAVDPDGRVIEMPWIGRFNHDNQIGVPGFPGHAVVLNFDDAGGQDTAESELYMYVAEGPEGVLSGDGRLYVLKSDRADHVGELEVGASVTARWVAVPDTVARDFEGLQAFAHDEGVLSFVRLEDGYRDKRPGAAPAVYFHDTGRNSITNGTGAPLDKWGSIYRLEFDDPADPGGGTSTLTLLARSHGPDAGWASPDNGDMTSEGVVMLQEDPAAGVWSRPPAIFRLEIAADGSLVDPVGTRVAELTDPDCADDACDLGEWESSGILDASEWLGSGTWLFTVLAHDRPVPALDLAAGNGQILLLDEGL